MQAIERQVVGFEMPGTGIPGFAAHAAAISQAGIYDLHDPPRPDPRSRRPAPLGLESLTGLDDEAERSRDRLLARLAKSERVARRLADRRAAAHAVGRHASDRGNRSANATAPAGERPTDVPP